MNRLHFSTMIEMRKIKLNDTKQIIKAIKQVEDGLLCCSQSNHAENDKK